MSDYQKAIQELENQLTLAKQDFPAHIYDAIDGMLKALKYTERSEEQKTAYRYAINAMAELAAMSVEPEEVANGTFSYDLRMFDEFKDADDETLSAIIYGVWQSRSQQGDGYGTWQDGSQQVDGMHDREELIEMIHHLALDAYDDYCTFLDELKGE